MKKFALLVGNGFTLDFIDSHNLDLHSSFPLKNFNSTEINYHHFIDYLPTIKNELLGQDIADYKAIENYALKYKIGSFQEGQLRQFLAASYSLFQQKLDTYELTEWKWVKWLQQNKDFLSCAVSFNYDLVLERALKSAKIHYSRTGTDELIRKVPVMKPHGSIDFDISNKAISMPYQMRWTSLTLLNDAGAVEVLPKWDWFLPRTEADIIPPSVRNYQDKLRWVRTIFNTYASKSKELDALIIVGSSYWDVDREEINIILEKLPKTAKIYIMHPVPSEPLIDKIESLGLSWDNFNFDELPW